MKICYLSHSMFPSRAAKCVHIIKMCEALSKAGHEVTLYGYRKADTDTCFEDYDVQHTFELALFEKKRNIPIVGNIIFAQKVAKQIKKSPAELYIGRSIYLALAAGKNGAPVVYEAHALPATRWHRFLEKRLFKSPSFKRLVVISQPLKQDYLQLFPVLGEERLLVAPDGANIPKAPPTRESKPHDPLTIGYIGHLYHGRGMEIIIELARAMPANRFLVVGGEQRDIAYWKQECEGLDNITFAGYVSHGQLGMYYDRIDILLAPYQKTVSVAGNKGDTARWMSPMKLFEYMAHNKPFICSDLPVFRDVLQHGRQCLLCAADDAAAWEQALKTYIERPDYRRQLAQNAYDDFVQHYTWDARISNILKGL